tara:strand:+ start:4754 stop:4897 length:144 start_codon:yes stop_codon:yes gene_type:complete
MKETKRVIIETPIGSVESDSGNHLVDIVSVLFILAIVLIFKKLWRSI